MCVCVIFTRNLNASTMRGRFRNPFKHDLIDSFSKYNTSTPTAQQHCFVNVNNLCEVEMSTIG